jgi:shikimate dehydrogenase
MLSDARHTPGELRLGLVGAGIGASLTPRMHEREAARIGIACRYELLDVDASDEAPVLADLLDRVEADGWRGLNVTHPCKHEVVALLDDVSPEARLLQAVNTVVFADGRRAGHNTDWSGFAEGLRRGLPDARLDEVAVLGAGGAGAAVVLALLRTGAGGVGLDADPARAAALATRLRDAGDGTVTAAATDALGPLLAGVDGLVHATPTGMAASPGSAVPPALLHDGLWVADVVYRPLETELLRNARAAGCATLDGGRMAVFQAVHAFALFTGVEADSDRMAETFAEAIEEEGQSWTRA